MLDGQTFRQTNRQMVEWTDQPALIAIFRIPTLVRINSLLLMNLDSFQLNLVLNKKRQKGEEGFIFIFMTVSN